MGSSGKIITREQMRRWVRAAEKEMFDKVNWNVYVVCQVERISLKCLQYKDPNYSIFNRCSTRDVLQKRQEGLQISGRWLLCLWTAACQPTVLHSADDPQAWPRICQDQLSRLQHIWRPDLPLLIRESVKPAGCTWWQRFHSSIEINAILG